jgi:predicted nucleotidyltransferase
MRKRIESPLDVLRRKTGREWKHLARANAAAASKRKEIGKKLVGEATPPRNTSLVVFGSLARGELTENSDADWTLLVDGAADAGHVEAARKIESALSAAGLAEPGSSGTFGSMAFSHDLVHLIGGQEDTNQNTTRRVLLLLESAAVGNASVHRRVRTSILRRYVEEGDVRLVSEDERYKIPRFLLNDVVRFWRTMAVDFASKHHAQGGRKWGIRNIKLRFSRKLIFVAGMLNCSYCRINGPRPTSDVGNVDQLVGFLNKRFDVSPLDVLAQAVIDFGGDRVDAAKLFDVYDEFLKILGSTKLRKELEAVNDQNAAEDALFEKLRKMSHIFQEELLNLFYRANKELCELTQEYGVF